MQLPCWLVSGACWRQSYLQLCLKLTRSISMLKNPPTLLISSIASSDKNISLTWTNSFFISLLHDWTSGSLAHEFQKGWRETLKLLMKSATKRKYTKSKCIALAFILIKEPLVIVTIFYTCLIFTLWYFYICRDENWKQLASYRVIWVIMGKLRV